MEMMEWRWRWIEGDDRLVGESADGRDGWEMAGETGQDRTDGSLSVKRRGEARQNGVGLYEEKAAAGRTEPSKPRTLTAQSRPSLTLTYHPNFSLPPPFHFTLRQQP